MVSGNLSFSETSNKDFEENLKEILIETFFQTQVTGLPANFSRAAPAGFVHSQTQISDDVLIDPTAVIGREVSIGRGTVLNRGVVIADGAIIWRGKFYRRKRYFWSKNYFRKRRRYRGLYVYRPRRGNRRPRRTPRWGNNQRRNASRRSLCAQHAIQHQPQHAYARRGAFKSRYLLDSHRGTGSAKKNLTPKLLTAANSFSVLFGIYYGILYLKQDGLVAKLTS